MASTVDPDRAVEKVLLDKGIGLEKPEGRYRWPKITTFDARVHYIDGQVTLSKNGPGFFVVLNQKMDQSAFKEVMRKKMNAFYSNIENVRAHFFDCYADNNRPEVGDFVVVKINRSFERARVLAVKGKTCEIFMLDMGHIENVAVSTLFTFPNEKLLPVGESIHRAMEQETSTMVCRLAEVAPTRNTSRFNQHAVNKFDELVGLNHPIGKRNDFFKNLKTENELRTVRTAQAALEVRR